MRPPTAALMRRQHFGELEADREAGIQAGHRFLENHRDFLAPNRPARGSRDPQQIPAVIGQAVRRHGRGPGQ